MQNQESTLQELLQTLIKQTKTTHQLQNQILMSHLIANAKIPKKDKQLLLLLLQDRDRNYLRINHNPQVFERITQYLELLRPVRVERDSLVRIGGKNDGGYVMSKIHLKMGGGGQEFR